MKFRDYQSAWMELTQACKHPRQHEYLASIGIKISDGVEKYYALEFHTAIKHKSPLSSTRFLAEAWWHKNKRPFFNVHPVIERKLLEIDDALNLKEVHLPFPAMEVRTKNNTFLVSDLGPIFYVCVELDGMDYQDFTVLKIASIKDTVDAPSQGIAETHLRLRPKTGTRSLTNEMRADFVHLVAGICMLAKDKSIVVPVVLANDRKDGMTPEELQKYSERATKRTGRIGFDVGKELEKASALVHYRNGCFAKYYVSPSHEQYPDNATTATAPIIKWRSGAVVNERNTPKVPTGFHDEACK
jgi:hypothetical protein